MKWRKEDNLLDRNFMNIQLNTIFNYKIWQWFSKTLSFVFISFAIDWKNSVYYSEFFCIIWKWHLFFCNLKDIPTEAMVSALTHEKHWNHPSERQNKKILKNLEINISSGAQYRI